MKLSVKETSIKLNKSERTVYAWLKAGKLQGEKVDGKWQILASSVESKHPEQPEKKELTVAKQPANVENIEALNCVFGELNAVSKAMQDVKASILAEEQKAQENKKREIEILTRVVKNQLKLKEENVELRKQNLFLQNSIRKIVAQLEQLKAENSLKQQKTQSQKTSHYTSSQSNGQELQSNSSGQGTKQIKSDENAEKWVRNNIPKWFNQPCGFGQLAKYSFEDIALNKAPKANIKGKEQPSRAYLHVLAKKEDSWRKFKAIVALEITEGKKEMYSKSYNHYAHPYEVGG